MGWFWGWRGVGRVCILYYFVGSENFFIVCVLLFFNCILLYVKCIKCIKF